jgi:CRISPR/Cas system-associated endoribonuclease Cas2
MQRVGRVNRIGTKFKEIFVYNFFPTKQSNDQLKLKETAESKLHMFMTLLGEDAKFLTENEPIASHELFNKLLSKETISGEEEIEESELKYLSIIKEIKEKNKDLFEKIKRIPKKSKTGRKLSEYKDHLLTFFKRGIVSEFYLVSKNKKSQELTFLEAIKLLECDEKTKKQKFPLNNYYDLLRKNKEQFEKIFEEEAIPLQRLGRGHTQELIKTLQYMLRNEKWDDEDEEYLNRIKDAVFSGRIPPQIIREANKEIKKFLEEKNFQKIFEILKTKIPKIYLEKHLSEYQEFTSKREVILSEYFI